MDQKCIRNDVLCLLKMGVFPLLAYPLLYYPERCSVPCSLSRLHASYLDDVIRMCRRPAELQNTRGMRQPKITYIGTKER